MGFFHSSGSSNNTCPDKTLADPVQVPIVGNLSFHHLMVIISGACLAFSCIICFFLILRHATHYSLPKEQKHIIRIVFMIPVFAATSLLAVAFNSAAKYLVTINGVYEAFALTSFFYLLCAFIEEDDIERQSYFSVSGTMKHYIGASIGVFQFPVVMIIVLIATDVTEAIGKYCSTSNKAYFAHIWLTIITMFSTTYAILSCLKFYKAVKPRIHTRKPLLKLIAFKLIVFLSVTQSFIFSLLTSNSALHPTTKTTFNDLTIALPSFLLSLECVLFSLFFLYVYRTREYMFSKGASAVPLGHGGYTGGFLGVRAYGDAINMTDLIWGILSVPKFWGMRKNVDGGEVVNARGGYESAGLSGNESERRERRGGRSGGRRERRRERGGDGEGRMKGWGSTSEGEEQGEESVEMISEHERRNLG